MLFFFFFSSRRRHTRSLCDWSSDVCSSDLSHGPPSVAAIAGNGWRPVRAVRGPDRSRSRRSEERRVGKECRSRWAPDHEKKERKKKKDRLQIHKQQLEAAQVIRDTSETTSM